MKLYSPLADIGLLTSDDVHEIARLVHNIYRGTLINSNSFNQTVKDSKDAILRYAETIVSDIINEKLPPHPMAGVHLLSLYKVAEQFELGLKFWKWLQEQERLVTDARTYGAAIELLAYQGQPLHILEEIYQQALRRYPDNFGEYHLSPEAKVSIVNEESNAPGIRLMLLQGILTARLLHGDWRNAYLALDTCVRLHPTQIPSRFIELFLYERPLSEGLEILLLACRSGCPPKAGVMKSLLESLSSQIELSNDTKYTGTAYGNGKAVSQEQMRMAVIQLTSYFAYVGAGGEVHSSHLNAIIKGLLGSLPVASIDDSDLTRTAILGIQNDIIAAVKDIEDGFSNLGINLTAATYNTKLSWAGKLGRKDYLDTTLKDMGTAKVRPTQFTYLSLISASGYLGDNDLMEASWAALAGMDLAMLESAKNWKTLHAAAARSNNLGFLSKTFLGNKNWKSMETYRAVKKLLESEPREDISSLAKVFSVEPAAVSTDLLLQPAYKIHQMANMLKEISKNTRLHDFSSSPIKLDLSVSPFHAGISERMQRSLWEDTTVETLWHPEMDREAVKKIFKVAPTGLFVRDIRFEGWKTVNRLLAKAEEFERWRDEEVEQAILAETAVKRRKTGKPQVLGKIFDESLVGTVKTRAKAIASPFGWEAITLKGPEGSSTEEARRRIEEKRVVIETSGTPNSSSLDASLTTEESSFNPNSSPSSEDAPIMTHIVVEEADSPETIEIKKELSQLQDRGARHIPKWALNVLRLRGLDYHHLRPKGIWKQYLSLLGLLEDNQNIEIAAKTSAAAKELKTPAI
jgi:hypothetical protein